MIRKLLPRLPLKNLKARFSTQQFVGGKSWIPTQDDLLQKVTTQSLIHEISTLQMQSAMKTVPWFLKQMPASYFKHIPDSMRRQHILAISAIRELQQSDLSLRIMSNTGQGENSYTLITNDAKAGTLFSQLNSLSVPANSHLSKVKVFSSADNQLALNIYTFQDDKMYRNLAVEADAAHIFTVINDLKLDSTNPDLYSKQSIISYLSKCTAEYVKESDPNDFILQRNLYEKVRSSDRSEVHIETNPNSQQTRITIASSNVRPEVLFRITASILNARKINVLQAHLDTVSDPENSTDEIPGSVTMLQMVVNPDVVSSMSKKELSVFESEIRRAKWLDDDAINLGLVSHPDIGLQKAEIITALCSMLHGPLSKINPQAYASTKSILQVISSKHHFIGLADSIAQLFVDKFKPEGKNAEGKVTSALSDSDFNKRANEISTKIGVLQFETAKTILSKMLDATKLTLRTNLYNRDRYALSLRVHPSLMVGNASSALPFGVFFAHGRFFNAFHCRFRDIARGGLRIVSPQNADQYALESTRHFDEVYGLSYAQQLKNKDIPEGGAKGVILVNSPGIAQNNRFFNIRKSIRAFTDSLLDLIVEDSVKEIVDHYGKDELIYLGPDENVVPSDIDWICSRAKQRGYPIPAAFMSSKRGAGFNHKEFGVTSEGVVVYLDVALKATLGIDPSKAPFTLKITGGPDGDVAGNLIKIVIRNYGENVKILGIADGFGVAEDLDGLNPKELMRLVDESLPITSFDKSKLSSKGVMMDISTEEGLARRNSMHFRIKSDAFVPAGGRPNTINADNCMQFFDENGKPCSPLIVEGANIFITKEARQMLYDKGSVPIVKDSSANKCGVITSSSEVAASMLLSTQEFMNIKDELVKDVIQDLHSFARQEAELLFKEYKNYPGNLPHFSERISFAIGKVTDAITDHLADVNPGDPLFEELFPLVIDNLPKKLAEVAGDRVRTRFPVQYQRNAIASTLASRLVYSEGIHFVESQPDEKMAERAIAYYRETLKINKLLDSIEKNKLAKLSGDEKDMLHNLLKRGGARTSLGVF